MKKFFHYFTLSILLFSCQKEYEKKPVKPTPKIKSITENGVKYDGPEKYSYYLASIKHGGDNVNSEPKFGRYKPGYKEIELKKMLSRNNSTFAQSRMSEKSLFSNTYAKEKATFIERGPFNVPGRTRPILVDVSDPTGNTWYAGSTGGGVWKTTDESVTWSEISNGMESIAISWLDQSKSQPNVLYAATGVAWVGGIQDITGAGVYKSVDSGKNWINVSPRESNGYVLDEFNNVSRLLVDPTDPDIVIASTTEDYFAQGHIWKTIDGGKNWTEVASASTRIQQVIAAPSDFNIQYAAVRGVGVLRSVDRGSTWTNPGGINLSGTIDYDSEDGILAGGGSGAFGRLELAVSYQDPYTIYASIDGDAASYLKVSYDGGVTWNLVKNEDGSNDDWLIAQGWFDNTITVNPFNDSIVYYAGRDASKATILSDPGVNFSGSTTTVTLDNTSSFLQLVNIWGGNAVGYNNEWNLHADAPELVDVEIRFGPGKSQMAYRFSVPEGSTSGVSHANYTYQDVVEVPFEVWNISADPPEQITVSFRDNKNDGSFNITTEYGESREYIFPQNIPYDPTMSQTEITQQWGQIYKSLFLIWPYLSNNVSWDPNNLPNSSIKIESVAATYKTLKKNVQYMTDYYDNGGAESINQNVHVDHHNLGTIIDSDNTFRIYLGTDGGIFYTNSSMDPGVVDNDFKVSGKTSNNWYQPAGGYNTTQFYGADKVVGYDQYFGGSQDNGTFLSPRNLIADETTTWSFEIGGDGFEAIAHHTDPNKLIGGSQGNNFYRSTNGGASWSYAQYGLEGADPFITRLSSPAQDPDVLYAVTNFGVMKSNDFGESWQAKQVEGNWNSSFWSGTDVEVSLANPRYVWAGSSMSFAGNIFLSKDWGETYESVPNFSSLGRTSGIYSHPTEDSTAYVLFGMPGAAKVLQTRDLGETWEDLSGFTNSNDGKSLNGFPDVPVYSFLVMPHDKDIMWAGTEVGLIESTDGGASWHLVESNLPYVTIWDLKLKDEGQIVIATHGRGVWTATIDDLKSYEPKPAILPPFILSAYQLDSEDSYVISTNINTKSSYDSLVIKANNVKRDVFQNVDKSDSTNFVFEVDDKGDYTIQAFGYKDGLEYPSNEYDIILNPTLQPRTEYSTTFSDLVGDEFGLDRFRIGIQGGFEGRQLHTEHPYESGVAGGYDDGYSVHALLNIPIIITDYTPSIRFKEIVLVEPGEPGTSFGDWNFWDYVIVEASKDGVYWRRLIDGYDSDADPAWRTAYNIGEFGSPDLIRDRQINFSPHFSVGDTVKVRFRMFSDDLTVSWGWMVDDLYIQKDLPVVQGIEFTELDKDISIYPNPTSGEFSIDFNDTWQGDVDCKITDIFGRSIYTNTLDNKSSNSSHKIDITESNNGVYIIQLVQGEKKTMKKIIKE